MARRGMDRSGGGFRGGSVHVCATAAVRDPTVGVIAQGGLVALVVVLVHCGVDTQKTKCVNMHPQEGLL